MTSPDANQDDIARLLISDQPRLRLHVRTLVGDPHLGEDILQEVAVVVLRSWRSFTPGTSFRAWVNEIARRIALAECRRRGRRPLPLLAERVEEIVAAAQEEDAWDREREALRHCLQQVPDVGRKALALRYGEELSSEEIARSLGRSIDGVKGLLKRVRAQVAECIDHRLTETNAQGQS